MFRRLILEDSAALFTLAAFITAASIFVAITWRAIHMNRAQTAKFEHLPFDTETPAASAAEAERSIFNAQVTRTSSAMKKFPGRAATPSAPRVGPARTESSPYRQSSR